MSCACFETPGNGLTDVIQCLGLRASLRDAARNGRALRNEHASLVGLQRHQQLHTRILLQAKKRKSEPMKRNVGRHLSNIFLDPYIRVGVY